MKNIILVEDNKIERRNIGRIIEEMEECSLVGVFFNGVEAFDFLSKNDVDIVITDVQMPLMDGIELSQKIREEKIDVEIIIISGYQDFDNAKSAIGLDVVDYVMKPVINNELENAINKSIKRLDEKRIKDLDYKQMLEQIEFSKKYIVEQFVKSLVMADVDDDYVKKNESFLDIDVTSGFKSVIILKIKETSEKDVIKRINSIREKVADYCRKNIKIYPFVSTENEISAVVVGDNCSEILANIITLKNKLIKEYNLNIYVAHSCFSNDLHDVPKMYDMCVNAVKTADEKWNVTEVIADGGDCSAYSDMQDILRGYLDKGDINGVADYIAQALEKCKTQVELKDFVIIYFNMLELIMRENGINLDNDDSICAEKVWDKINDFDSIANVENFILNLFKTANEKFDEMNNDRSKVVNRIKKIIAERYSEHITVESIAKEVSFSRKHIHRIFTNEVGMSIFEYLTNYRIEVAKKLILENKAVEDIVYMIGYKDVKYFYEVFKEKTAMNPKQYKEAMQNETEENN